MSFALCFGVSYDQNNHNKEVPGVNVVYVSVFRKSGLTSLLLLCYHLFIQNSEIVKRCYLVPECLYGIDAGKGY